MWSRRKCYTAKKALSRIDCDKNCTIPDAMSLINISSVRQQALRQLARLDPPAGLELLSYKRNRSVAVVRLAGNRYQVIERGYVDQEVEVDERGLARLLKIMIKREFPRSRKVRLFRFASPEALQRHKQKI